MPARRFLLIDLIIVVAILHGSLYPYDFHAPPGGIGPLATLLASWRGLGTGYSDVVANILLYVPFGFFAALTLPLGRFTKIVTVALIGLVLCTGVELAQYYEVERLDSMSDVYFNTCGSALGATAAVAMGGIGRYLPLRDIAAKPVPLLLLVALLGYHLFPYVPTINLHKYWLALRPLLLASPPAPSDILRYVALWLTTCCLIGSLVGFARSQSLAPLFMAGVFAAKVAIISLIVTPAEAVGAGAALLLWLLTGRFRRLVLLVTVAVLGVSIVVGRLQPFEFLLQARPFGWLPFRGFLYGSLAIDTMALMEKFFLYGSLIWLAAEALLPLWLGTLLVAAMLLCTSLVETHLPGRSAETTDAVMALMIGVIFAPFRLPRRPAAAGRSGAARRSARSERVREDGDDGRPQRQAEAADHQ
jgi:VanZ family protein